MQRHSQWHVRASARLNELLSARSAGKIKEFFACIEAPSSVDTSDFTENLCAQIIIQGWTQKLLVITSGKRAARKLFKGIHGFVPSKNIFVLTDDVLELANGSRAEVFNLHSSTFIGISWDIILWDGFKRNDERHENILSDVAIPLLETFNGGSIYIGTERPSFMPPTATVEVLSVEPLVNLIVAVSVEPFASPIVSV